MVFPADFKRWGGGHNGEDQEGWRGGYYCEDGTGRGRTDRSGVH